MHLHLTSFTLITTGKLSSEVIKQFRDLVEEQMNGTIKAQFTRGAPHQRSSYRRSPFMEDSEEESHF